MRIARVFPRRTRATPVDDLAYYDAPDMLVAQQGIDEVHVSIAFTWDIERGRRLADAWDRLFPGRVRIGGPAFAYCPPGEFVAGRYLGEGYTITSRGCPGRCWFCRVPSVEGGLRELPIVPGWKVQDNNLLACSREHFRAVVAMLAKTGHRAEFTGGLDATLLEDWHIDLLATLRPRPTCFFAFDPGSHYDVLESAVRDMQAAGWTTASHRLRCYVLIGYPGDSLSLAESRLTTIRDQLGVTPAAMLWREPHNGRPHSSDWSVLQRRWMRPAIIHAHRNHGY